MCEFVISSAARNHLVQRICERYLNSSDKDPDTRQQANAILKAARAALVEHTPPGWRFTRNPAAHFFVSLVHRTPGAPAHVISEAQLKLLGGTYRRGQTSGELEKRLKLLVAALNSRRPGTVHALSSTEVRSELVALRDLYLQDLQDPDAVIVHELKTAYFSSEEIAQRRRAKRQALDNYPHTMVLRAMNLPHLHAAIPNALLCPREGDAPPYQLWVRQGDSWWAPELKSSKKARELAVFVPLQATGPDHSQAQLWSFDIQGAIRRLEGAGSCASCAPHCETPAGFRSEGYWHLPTRLDTLWLDADYCLRERVPDLTGLDLVRAQVIKWIYELANAETDKDVSPPAWLGKYKS
jgi:hypothetical protein